MASSSPPLKQPIVEQSPVIAERVVYYKDEQGEPQEMLVKVQLPRLDGSTWMCSYSIASPYDRHSTAYGVDAAQALSLALVKIGIDLTHPPARLRGKLISDAPNFGFPVLPEETHVQAA